ncbi:helix-turn-helix transcriptional regulator [Nocardia sp. NPDC052566]|uniref:helix-turn-helix transcriptional regulator n=1 Tax=Nocardia sp. NPDC052566 TaxID=3364330 RepID=UPI0037C83C8A
MGELLRIDQVAERLTVSVAVLRKWRIEGKGPRAFLLGNRLRYSAPDVEAWLIEQRERAVA